MKQIYNILPRRITKEEIALAPMDWAKSLSNYANHRRKAIREVKPAFNTLVVMVLAAIAKRDRHFIDIAIELTKENVPKYVYLAMVGTALCGLGAKSQGLVMLREAVEIDSLPSILLNLASAIDDMDEKEKLARKVLDENPKDCDALRHLAYAKYSKGECEESEHLVDRILLNEPDNIFARELKGHIYLDRREYKKALKQFLRIKMKPAPVSLQLKICHCYYSIGKIRKAKKIAKNIKDKITRAYDIECGVERAQEILTEILNS